MNSGTEYVGAIKENYDLEVEKVIKEIFKTKVKKILLQFPDGLKPLAVGICFKLRKKFPDREFFIWAGSCFGACDIPKVKEIDLLIQFGHREMKEKRNKNEI